MNIERLSANRAPVGYKAEDSCETASTTPAPRRYFKGALFVTGWDDLSLCLIIDRVTRSSGLSVELVPEINCISCRVVSRTTTITEKK